jgi:hypothetical protein
MHRVFDHIISFCVFCFFLLHDEEGKGKRQFIAIDVCIILQLLLLFYFSYGRLAPSEYLIPLLSALLVSSRLSFPFR